MNQIYGFNIGEPVSGSPIGDYRRSGLDVTAHLFMRLVASDAVEANSTTTTIKATAHVALRGDLIRFTSGANSGIEVPVKKIIDADTIELLFPVTAPSVADTFNILRFTQPTVDSSGSILVSAVSGMQVRATKYHDTASTNINDNAGLFVEVATVGAIGSAVTRLHITTTIGEPLDFRKGANAAAAAANPRLFVVNRGEGPLTLEVTLAATDQIWVRSLTTTNVTSGEIVMNLMGV